MPKVLVTGSSGFIGGAVANRFRQLGWQVMGISRRPSTIEGFFSHDLTRPLPVSLQDELKDVDVVVHAAARSSPWGTKAQFRSANVVATQNLIDYFQPHCGDRTVKFIFLSSSSVYYCAEDQLGITEATPQAKPAVNQYAQSKQQAEQCVRSYQGPSVILRPRAVYGRGDTVLFSRIIRAARAGRLPLLIRAGQPVVGDLISIHNLVHCIEQAAIQTDVVGDINLTDAQPVEIVEFLMSVFDRLEISRPHRKLSVQTAFRIAHGLEWVHRIFLPWMEPSITRFGVHVFAYSKTFDVSRMLETFGEPQWTVQQSVEDFIDWINQENPYQL